MREDGPWSMSTEGARTSSEGAPHVHTPFLTIWLAALLGAPQKRPLCVSGDAMIWHHHRTCEGAAQKPTEECIGGMTTLCPADTGDA